jgi:hypothetical protein
MILAHEKWKRAKRIFIFLAVGLFLTLAGAFGLWTWGSIAITGSTAWAIIPPAMATAFLAYLAGAIIQRTESHSLGIDMYEMDEAEISVTIALLEKEIRTRVEQPVAAFKRTGIK